MSDFFIDIGIAVLLRLLADGKIPARYHRAMIKLRDKLNLAFPPELGIEPSEGIKLT